MTWYSFLCFVTGGLASIIIVTFPKFLRVIRMRRVTKQRQLDTFYSAADAINKHIAQHKAEFDYKEIHTHLAVLTNKIKHIEERLTQIYAKVL